MNKIILKFDNTLTAIAGYEYGEEIFKNQVEKNYKIGEENIIEFPKEIESVAISFVQGFLKEPLRRNGVDKTLSELKIVGNKKFVNKFYKVI